MATIITEIPDALCLKRDSRSNARYSRDSNGRKFKRIAATVAINSKRQIARRERNAVLASIGIHKRSGFGVKETGPAFFQHAGLRGFYFKLNSSCQDSVPSFTMTSSWRIWLTEKPATDSPSRTM